MKHIVMRTLSFHIKVFVESSNLIASPVFWSYYLPIHVLRLEFMYYGSENILISKESSQIEGKNHNLCDWL